MAKPRQNGDPRAGKLFYGVILADRACDMGNIGLDGKRVHSVHYRDLGALVSDYPQVTSIKLLRKNLAPHHEVLREAARRFTTVPARFGQIARDAGDVTLALRRNYHHLRREVARLDGKVEMGLRIWWRCDNVFEQLLEEDAELRARRNQAITEGRSADRLAAIDFGRYVYARMSRARNQVTERVLAALPEGEVRLDKVVDESMVTNAALLVRKELRPELQGAIDQLARTESDRYSVTLDGPWPPFSFVERIELDLSRA